MDKWIFMIADYHHRFFLNVYSFFDGWGIQILARMVFASTLLIYFLNSASTKIGDYFWQITPGAFAHILPKIAERHEYNPDMIPLFPYHFIVYLGTYAEIFLPIMIVAGLLTRLASLSFILVIFTVSLVDIFGHEVGRIFIGRFFDGDPSGNILDQRLYWVFLLSVLVIMGGGKLSLDNLLWQLRKRTSKNNKK